MKTGQSKVSETIVPLLVGRFLGCFPVSVASRACHTNLSWDILDTWSNLQRWVLSPTYKVLQLHSCTFLQSATPWTLCKSQCLSLVLEIALLQSLSKIHDRKLRSDQRPIRKMTALWCLKPLILWTQEFIAQVQLCLLNNALHVSLPLFHRSSLVNTTLRCLNFYCRVWCKI